MADGLDIVMKMKSELTEGNVHCSLRAEEEEGGL